MALKPGAQQKLLENLKKTFLLIEHHALDTNAGKQQSYSTTDV